MKWCLVVTCYNFYVRYAHQNANPNLQVGSQVSTNDIIGHVGNTGMSNMAVHLHVDMGTNLWTPRTNRINIDDFTNNMRIRVNIR